VELASRLHDVRGDFGLLDRQGGENLGEVRLLGECGKGGIAHVFKKNRSPKGGSLVEGISTAIRVKRQQLRQKDIGRVNGGVELRKGVGDAIEDGL
jgi:hypothetical protein